MSLDIVIVGAGAAGLATAIFTRRLDRTARVRLVDGARRPGAKILVSGGSRCNVTNVRVTEADFHGGSPGAIRQVLRALPVPQTIQFFAELGVPLHEEPNGKLFPDSNRSRDVLDALLTECARLGVERIDECRVRAVAREAGRFVLDTSRGPMHAGQVVLATGGQSLPKSGSDGTGYALARSLGHHVVPPVPALVPLLLDEHGRLPHAALSGVSHDAEIAVWVDGRLSERVQGALLWTHFGISGPAALDVSRHWTRATQEGRAVALTLNVFPGLTFETADTHLVALASARPRASLQTVLTQSLPAALVSVVLQALGLDAAASAGALTRESRKRLAHALTEWTLPVTGSRGYNYAEVTAGGVPLQEVQAKTLESRVCPDLFLVGEVLDVDGRLGGFNFQWAWASAATAARGLVRKANHASR